MLIIGNLFKERKCIMNTQEITSLVLEALQRFENDNTSRYDNDYLEYTEICMDDISLSDKVYTLSVLIRSSHGQSYYENSVEIEDEHFGDEEALPDLSSYISSVIKQVDPNLSQDKVNDILCNCIQIIEAVMDYDCYMNYKQTTEIRFNLSNFLTDVTRE